MCLRPLSSCRLCLSDNINERCLDLCQDVATADQLQELLCLQWSLTLAVPHHVCITCHGIISAFQLLKQTAHNNEVTLHEKYSNAKDEIIAKEDNTTADEDMDPCLDDMDDVADSFEDKSDNMNDVKKEDPEEADDEKFIKISFAKTEAPNPKPVKKNNPRHNSIVDTRTGKVWPPRIRVRDIVEQQLKAMNIDSNDIRAIEAARFICPLCGKTGLKRCSLSSHFASVHAEKTHKCQYPGCDMSFTQKPFLDAHSIMHKEKEVCPICGGKYQRLRVHIRERHNKEPYRCDYCGKEYYSRCGIDHHMATQHLGTKSKEKCPQCGEEVQDVRHHIQWMHEGRREQRSHPCELAGCGRMFQSAQAAKTHYTAAHTDIREQCKICGTMVKQLSNHVSQVHNNKSKHKCEHCGKGFSKRCDVKLHIQRVHENRRYICPQCNKVVSKIREHLRSVHKVTDINMENIKVVQNA